MLKLKRRKDNIRAVKATLSNIEELRELIGESDVIAGVQGEQFYYRVLEIENNIPQADFNIYIDEYLVNSNGELFKQTEKDLFKRYEVI